MDRPEEGFPTIEDRVEGGCMGSVGIAPHGCGGDIWIGFKAYEVTNSGRFLAIHGGAETPGFGET